MPKVLERKLEKQALKRFGSTTSERARKYIYGTLRKTGWTPSHQKKAKTAGRTYALKRAALRQRAKGG